MSDDLLRQLRALEEEYAGQPPVVQQADLRTINQLRSRLGMPPVDARLKEAGGADGAAKPKPAKAAPEVQPDHTAAREVYRAYLKKEAELEAHRAYAEQVVRATAGRGQTPVRPLATMGTGGGPLLCDRCRKPMVLEGGPSHGMAADEAWRKSPRDGWTSWILGGMLVEVQTNGTLRIYHGYPGRNDRQCCNAARREDEQTRAAFRSGGGAEKQGMILAFLECEFPNLESAERLGLLSKILDVVYSYDPGIGVNRPDGSD